MRNLTTRLFLLLAILAAGMSSTITASTPTPIRGVVRVKLQPEVANTLRRINLDAQSSNGVAVTGIQSLDASLKRVKGRKLRPLFPCAPDREAAHAEFGLDRWYEIVIDDAIDPLEAKRVLTNTPGVQTATTRVPMKLLENSGKFRVLDPTQIKYASSSQMPFNDPRLPLQWHYTNDGSMPGAYKGADINLFKAWQITSGSPNVVVAIIDGGIDFTHEDLADAMWVNQAELNGREGIDDDGDGYIDNIYGFNFCTREGTIYPHNHGTHVAGTVGAVNNNATGIAGVAGGDGTPGSGVRLMSCQVFDPRTGSGDADFAAAIIYAADKGATIAQCSWGWDFDGYYEQDVVDAIHYFTKSARSNNMIGGLCIFAAGNTGVSGQFYPACLDEVISVAAMTYDLYPASYSSHGPWVDVTAPGGLLDFDAGQGVLSTLPGNTYGFQEGTSMATPHVSGIAALILSKYGSPTLVNETVRQQLITSVNDFYTRNPEAKGNFGSGYIDAYKALQWGDGSAPHPVTDLKVVASQDNAVLSWTIPESSDHQVNSHIIYYSTKPFDNTNVDDCNTIIVDTKFASSGDPYTYEVTGLEALTTYYFAVRAVDRWSHSSELSEVVTATTNAGPKMTLSRAAMTVRTTDGETWSQSSFDIGNIDEGLLKWSANMRTLSSSISAYSTAKGLLTHPFSGHMSIEPCAVTPVPTPEDIAEFTREDFPRSITNAKSIHAFIGDKETSNSMAQLFTVDPERFPDGFNLTHIYMLGSYGINPTVEVYRNTGTLNNSTLLERMVLNTTAPYYMDQPLIENLFFRPGESFYIVVHFTEFKNRNYPLGLGLSNGSADASHAYMSTDLGKTWSSLPAALKGSTYEEMAEKATWCITAKSLYPDWSQILTLTPWSGQVEGGCTQTVTASHNGTPVPNGQYRARIHFDTNETNPEGKTINVNINVSGYKPEVEYTKIVQFGNVLVGQSKTIEIEVTNTGYGTFGGGANSAGIYSDKITCTSPMFKGPNTLPFGIPSRSSVTIPLTYAPTEAGSHAGQIIFKDKDGKELRVNVQGAATDPAKLEVNPATVEVGDLVDGAEPRDVSFKITNAGKYPLQFLMPKFTSTVLDEVSSGGTHRFGYTWEGNLYGPTVPYDGAPRLIDPVDVSKSFSDYSYFSQPIDIGFAFPFYGKTYDQIYISSFGTLTFAPYFDGYMYSPITERSSYLEGLGAISAYGFQCQFGPNSRVEYARQDGKFVVNFKDVLVLVYDGDYIPASYHIILSPNGDIQISFDNYNNENVFEKGHSLWVGIVDPAEEDPLTVTSGTMTNQAYHYDDPAEEGNRWRHIKTGTTIKISAPKPDMIRAISPASGVVAPGESVDVTASVAAAEEMYAGATNTNLVILSNDLNNPATIVRFNANIIGDLNPLLELASDNIDFGRVFRTATAQIPVVVQNRGRSDMTLQSVSIAEGKFTHNFTQPVVIPAGQSKDVVVTLPTVTEGAVADVMTITTSAGETTVALRGEVIGVPQATLSYKSIEETLPAGETRAVPLTITNDGNEELNYSIVPGNHVVYAPEFEAGSSTDYVYTASVDDPAAKREWIDIETNGLGTQYNFTYYMKHDYVEVELPFSFPYYGKYYDKMYIYNAGFVSFTHRKDDVIWPEPPEDFPQGTLYTNIIAPYWGLHTMDSTASAGVFHYESDEQAVVSFIEYGNSMNMGVDFQLVIRKDGSFTFNYRPHFAMAMIFSPFGVAGISNEGATQGLILPERYIAFGNTVNFVPMVNSHLAPGESRVADVRVDADVLAGDYKSSLTINTNVPTTPKIDIPVKMHVTGEPKPVFPEDVVVEQVAGYRKIDTSDELLTYSGANWYVPLTVANDGKRAFTIEKIKMDCPTYEGMPLFSLYWYGTYIDEWFGNETTGWTTYNSNKISVGTSPVRLAIPITASDLSIMAGSTPGEYDIKLTFELSGLGDVKSKDVNVKIIITEQPNIGLNPGEIRVEGAGDDEVTDRTFNITNTDGGTTLKYTLTVDPSGVGEQVPDYDTDPDYVAPKRVEAKRALPLEDLVPAKRTLAESFLTSTTPSKAVGVSEHVYDTPNDMDFEYNRGLYWPALEGSTIVYNYGTTNTYGIYKAATAYVGPEGGFNISHIYTAMHPYLLDNSDIKIEIVNGDPQRGGEVIGTGTYHIGTVDTQLYENIRTIIKLDRPVYISEGQEFYVVTTFPAGQAFPATLTRKEESVVSNRYLGHTDDYGWFDVASLFADKYGSLGYIMTCLETVEGDAWVKLLDPDGNTVSTLAGEIPANGSKDVTLRLSAGGVSKETDNRAVVIVKSNDPKASVINMPVTLSKNSTPEVTLASSGVIAVPQGANAEIEATVIDRDNDNMTIQLTDNGHMSRIVSVTPISQGEASVADDGFSAEISGATEGATVKVAIAAPDDAPIGRYSLTLSATDTRLHEGSAIAIYSVEHVNHAPEAVAQEDWEMQRGTTSNVLGLATLFRDPDGDVLTYEVETNKPNVIEIYRSDNLIIIRAIANGTATLRATATDPDGLTATNSFKVKVSATGGVSAVNADADIDIFPNPAKESVNILTDKSGVTNVEIFNMAGAVLYGERYIATAGAPHPISVEALPQGFYIAKITLPDGSFMTRTIVKL